MELSARKKAVLAAVIRTYIDTGEPVGSKVLTGLLENAPSSATLRNEMSELCSLGLLTQPHTSAGRVPTNSALRLYVTRLMKPDAVADSTKRYIDGLMMNSGADTESLPRAAAQALSDLTGFPAVSCYITDNNVTVKKVGLVPVSTKSGLLYMVTSDGRERSRMCKIPQGFEELKGTFEKIIEQRICRYPLFDMNKAYLQNVIALAGLDALALMPLITAVFEMAAAVAVAPVNLRGGAALSRICGEDNARRIISLVQRREPLLNLLNSVKDDSGVIFGSETGFRELGSAAIATASYRIGERRCGRIGIIGPSRMSYQQIIPCIEYTAARLSEMLTVAEKDMED